MFLTDDQIAVQAGHDVCPDCGWCVTCDGHNMWCMTGGTSDGPDRVPERPAE
jgi:hypothetical protein